MVAKIYIYILALSASYSFAMEHIELGCNVAKFDNFKGRTASEIYDRTKLRYSPRSDHMDNMQVESGYLKVSPYYCDGDTTPYMYPGFVKDIKVFAGYSYILQLAGYAKRSGISKIFIGDGGHLLDYVESYFLHNSFMRFNETPELATAEESFQYTFIPPGNKGEIVDLHVGALFCNHMPDDFMYIKTLRVLLLEQMPQPEQLTAMLIKYWGSSEKDITIHRTFHNCPLRLIEKIAPVDYIPRAAPADTALGDDSDWYLVDGYEKISIDEDGQITPLSEMKQ